MSDVTDGTPAPESDGTPAAGTDVRPGPDGRPGPDEEGTPAGDEEAAYEAAAPAPLGVERTPTGRPAVDALLERLADADHLPADGHLDVYEDVHRGLRSELTSLDAAHPGPTPPTSSPPGHPTTTPHRGPSGRPDHHRS
ncbi:hypothetical protein [Streptomyces sp. NBC_01353]|uniref:hypothetical protein n=1 Tax=Streptomyces sp. NBC_01353 TaxID=2903835 RepID=UPI002E369E51|nr:hypothetical protein [Streptomyces sp. NBC_01353]